jgi:hypothetical protein
VQYLLLCYFDEERWAQMAEAQKDQIMPEYNTFLQAIVRSGHYRAGAKLQPTSMATVREIDGKRVITDVPLRPNPLYSCP